MDILNLPIIREFYFKLEKKNPDKIKIVMPKPPIENNHDNYITNDINIEFQKDLALFKKVISKKIKKEYLSNFYKNLNGLKITSDNIEKDKKQVLDIKGCYYQQENKIVLSKNIKPDTIFHELFHVASSTIKNGNKYSGLSQSFFYKGKWFNTAEGLNEGYTQILTERYFPNRKQELSSYPFEKEVALSLEKIIGKDKLEQFYFTNDLKGLMQELLKYTNRIDEIDSLIIKTDYINKTIYNRNNIKEIYKINKNIKEVTFILIKIEINKLKQELENNLITEKEFNDILIDFIKSLSKFIKIGIKKFYYINLKEIENYLKTTLGANKVKIKKI